MRGVAGEKIERRDDKRLEEKGGEKLRIADKKSDEKRREWEGTKK